MDLHQTNPTISSITGCYNGATFLAQTLDSLLGQTCPPEEVIVIDDGSTDDSAAIAERYGPPIRVIRQSNQGQPVSRNVGLRAARGDYLLFIDADDLLHPSALELLRSAVSKVPGSVGVMGFAAFRDHPAAPFAVKQCNLSNFFPEIIQGNFGPNHNRLVPRDLALRVGCFDPSINYFEDWHFWCRVALYGTPLVSIPLVGAYYRRHAASMSATTPKAVFIKGHVQVMEAMCFGILGRDEYLQNYGEVLFWCSWTALHRARQHGLTWRELGMLADYLREIARRGPQSLQRSHFVRMARILGIRISETLRNLLVRRHSRTTFFPEMTSASIDCLAASNNVST